MPHPRSITVSKAAPDLFEIRGCTHPYKEIFIQEGCEWQGRALSWMYHGPKLPDVLQKLADGTYGLDDLKTGVLAVEATTTPKPAETPAKTNPEQKADANPLALNHKFKVGDRVKTTLGRIGGIVEGYKDQSPIVRFGQYAPATFDEDSLLTDDITVYRDQLKVGMAVVWHPSNDVKTFEAVVTKLNAKTVTVAFDEKTAGGNSKEVKRVVTVENLRFPKRAAQEAAPTEAIQQPPAPEKPAEPKKKATPKSAKKPAALPTWETKNIQVAIKGGTHPVTAQVYGTIAIHKGLPPGDGRETQDLVITHIETGYAIVQFDYDWLPAERLRPLAEKLHGIDIKQAVEDFKKGITNAEIGEQVKEVVTEFRASIKQTEATN